MLQKIKVSLDSPKPYSIGWSEIAEQVRITHGLGTTSVSCAVYSDQTQVLCENTDYYFVEITENKLEIKFMVPTSGWVMVKEV